MPQGGIDEGEDPQVAALRELAEETAVTSAEIIAESRGWYNYDLPEHLIGKSWKGKYRGQTQKWFALRFTGEDSEIDLAPPGHKQEFDQWRWAPMDEVMDLIVPFKRQVYEQVHGRVPAPCGPEVASRKPSKDCSHVHRPDRPDPDHPVGIALACCVFLFGPFDSWATASCLPDLVAAGMAAGYAYAKLAHEGLTPCRISSSTATACSSIASPCR